MIEFQPWPKIPRLNREIVVTEKIDGTNAAVQIVSLKELALGHFDVPGWDDNVIARHDGYAVAAQSRKKLITPQTDNAGFARWVSENAETLVELLGPGVHFGEWWGQKIQRGYGLDHKRFSLFNTKQWGHLGVAAENHIGTTPVLYEGPFSQRAIEDCMTSLRGRGSYAAEGFLDPEGVVVYHTAANTMFKALLEGDDLPKGATP
jgi:hypothetical protein